MTQNQPLPNAWVEKIFARMQGIYGRDFTGSLAPAWSTALTLD